GVQTCALPISFSTLEKLRGRYLMTMTEACLEQSTFSIQEDPGGFCFESSRPSFTKASTHLAADCGVLLFTYWMAESPSLLVMAVTSSGVIQYTPGLEGSLVPYLS